MHELEPHYQWLEIYQAEADERSPFYLKEYPLDQYVDTIYGYYIHPQWDYIGSETLYIKILYCNYELSFVIIELIGEWNDTLHNDIMHFKRNIIDELTSVGISKFLLLGDYVFNFHGSDDCYYEEWFDDIEHGWIVAAQFRDHVLIEWEKYGIDNYINFGEELHLEDWRTLHPIQLFKMVDKIINYRLN